MTIHDVSPQIRVTESQVRSALSQAALFGGALAPRSDRYDSDGWVAPPDAIDAYHRHVDGLVIGELVARKAPVPRWMIEHRFDSEDARRDAFEGGVSGFPRQFEFIRSRVLEEKRQPLNAMRLFPRDGEVPLGAKQHTTRRVIATGEAQIHRGGSEFPRARTAHVEETFGTAIVVCAVSTNYFEMLTTDWAGIRQYQMDLKQAFRAVEERLNRIAWSGDTASKIDGVLNHRHLAKQVMPVAFDGSVAAETVTRALNDFVDTPFLVSGTVFRPNRLAVSPRIHRYLHTTKHSTTGGTDLTIAQFFLAGQDSQGIKVIDMAQELAGIGPSSEDGILAYRDDLDSTAHVLIQPPTVLPVFQSSPLDQTTVVFACTGGVTMGDVGNNILGYADAV